MKLFQRAILTAAFVLVSCIRLCAAIDDGPWFLISETDTEVSPLRTHLVDSKQVTIASWSFWTGKIGAHEVVLSRCDPGPLNAVAATTLAIRHFKPSLVVSFGTARAHNPDLHPLDAIVSRLFVPFDGFVSKRRELGEGSDPAQWRKLPHPMMTPGEKEAYTESFAADSDALAIFTRVPNPKGRTTAGVVGSAHQINQEADRRVELHAAWKTDCEDFISAHVAACASLFQVPAIALRVIEPMSRSRSALEAPNTNAADLCANMLAKCLDQPVEAIAR